MNHWFGDQKNPGMVQWLGPIDYGKLPSTVEYDWVKYQPE